MRPLILSALMVGTGCATPKVYAYSWGQIVKADQHSVNSACSDVGRWDDGTKKYRNDDVNGCATLKDGKCTIWVVNTIDGAKSLPHELAHCDGVDDPDKAGYEWN